jgi:hypothetical protein
MSTTRITTGLYGLISYWSDGNHSHQVNLDPPLPEVARPYHVVIRSEHHIPASVLVFARDEDHARTRLITSLRAAIAKDRSEYGARRAHHWSRILDALDHPEGVEEQGVEGGDRRRWWTEVQPYPIAVIAAKVNWASNGGLLD